MRTRLAAIALAMFLLAMGVVGYALSEARRDPVVRRASVTLPNWPASAAPIRVALLSDIHAESWTMDSDRLTRIVAHVNALRPDLILIAGDTIEGKGQKQVAQAAPTIRLLGALRARLGVVAVLGNHDYWTDPNATRRLLQARGITVLRNEAVSIGPLALGGLDDQTTRHARLAETLAAMTPLAGARVMLAHSPDIAPKLPGDISLLLAGHTHCGQVVLPLAGPVAYVSRYGSRYLCGSVREGPRTIIVAAGLGTSTLPLRLGAPPDLWLLTLGAAPSAP